jgi:hypothetical protein
MGVAYLFVSDIALPQTPLGNLVHKYSLYSLPGFSAAICVCIFLLSLLVRVFEQLSKQHLPGSSESAVLLSNLPSVLAACAVFISMLALALSLHFVWTLPF